MVVLLYCAVCDMHVRDEREKEKSKKERLDKPQSINESNRKIGRKESNRKASYDDKLISRRN